MRFLSKKRQLLYGILIMMLVGFLYGAFLERKFKRPDGIMAILTYPYRAFKWIKQNEPTFIPPVPEDSAQFFYGSRIQRTMTLLETSNIKNQNKVKILFYGQSIVAGLNAKSIIGKLKAKYPFAKIEYENRGIGGFTAPSLVRVATHDLYPYYPDLLIFHVYGGEENGELERIIYNTRKYTTSEILLFNHHYAWVEDSLEMKIKIEKDDISSDYWRFIGQKYGCELVDVRKHWKKYVDKYDEIDLNTLMGDKVHSNVHPNKEGHKLLEMLLLQHLKFNTLSHCFDNRGWFKEFRTFDIRRFGEERKDEIEISGNYQNLETGVIVDSAIISLNFSGNKIELIAPRIIGDFGDISILIDGVKPSSNSSLYYCTRPSEAYKFSRPAIKRVSLENISNPEKWQLIITAIDHKKEYLEYMLIGDNTRFDGIGNNKTKFISNSGKISIEPSDFFIFEADNYTKSKTPVGFKITWEIKALHNDRISYTNTDTTYLLAQGLRNTNHTLTLIQDGNRDGFPIKSIQVYSPPIRD